MKGLFPQACKPIGYAWLILSVFIPLLLSMFGLVHDQSLLLIKLGMKLSIWISLFMIFLSRTKDESEETANFRSKAMKYALYFWGLLYIALLINAFFSGNINLADNSIGIIYMVFNVLCFEFLLQKARIEKAFKRK